MLAKAVAPAHAAGLWCRYPSESARVARLQQTAVDADGKPLGARGGFSDENVLYDSAEIASQAFAEIRSAADRCPTDRLQLQPSKQRHSAAPTGTQDDPRLHPAPVHQHPARRA